MSRDHRCRHARYEWHQRDPVRRYIRRSLPDSGYAIMSTSAWSRGFGDFEGSYSKALRSSLTSNFSFKPRSLIDEERDRAAGGGKSLRRTLNGFQLICLGVGKPDSSS